VNIVASIRQRLKNIARDDNRPFNSVIVADIQVFPGPMMNGAKASGK